MSRSSRKNKIRGNTTATSEKKSKLKANRKLRRLTKETLKKGKVVLPLLREISDKLNFEKDGKKYDSNLPEKDLRK
ncbi:MAG: hypothetical protein ACQEWG_06275 [Bacteroidota bacterium]